MNKTLKITLIIVSSICVMGMLGYYGLIASLKKIDLVGYKDPKTVEANQKRWKSILLSAEFRNGTNYCEVTLLDSTNIELNLGDEFGGTFLNEKYQISNDTITVLGGIAEHARKYLKSDKFVIQNDRLFFNSDKNGLFDTSAYMNIKVNRLKVQ